MAHVQRMRYAYENQLDLYSLMASEIFNKKYEECLEFNPTTGDLQPEGKELRSQVKSVLLGLMYGRQPASIAKQFKKPAKWGEELYSKFFAKYPEVKLAETTAIHMASTLGYVTTMLGRKRRLPNMKLDPSHPLYVQDTRKCLNARIQGGCADLVKKCMVALGTNSELQELDAHMVLTIHDELILECPIGNAQRVASILSSTMKGIAFDLLKLPQKCDVEITRCWAEQKDD